jgi:hypothetical protein
MILDLMPNNSDKPKIIKEKDNEKERGLGRELARPEG